MSHVPIDFNPNDLAPWPPKDIEPPTTPSTMRVAPATDYARGGPNSSWAQEAINRHYSQTIAEMKFARAVPPKPGMVLGFPPGVPPGFVQPIRVAVYYDNGAVRRYPLGRCRVEDSDDGLTKVIAYEDLTLMSEPKSATITAMVAESEDGTPLCQMLEHPMLVGPGDQVRLSPRITLSKDPS